MGSRGGGPKTAVVRLVGVCPKFPTAPKKVVFFCLSKGHVTLLTRKKYKDKIISLLAFISFLTKKGNVVTNPNFVIELYKDHIYSQITKE